MAYTLSHPLSVRLSTGNYGIPVRGSVGRNGNGIEGVCLHVLESTLETYSAYLEQSRERANVRPLEHGSVHYVVTAGGTITQFVADTNTAWSIRELNGATWSLLDDFVGIDPNYLFINVGVEKFISGAMPPLMYRALADLLAKLVDTHEIPVDVDHIITHDLLDANYENCADAFLQGLLSYVSANLSEVTGEVTHDIGVMAGQIAELDTRIAILESNFNDSMETIATYADHVTTIGGPTTLGHVKESSTIDIHSSLATIDIVRNAASYKIVDGTQTLAPDIPKIVQFPTVISDTHPSNAPAWAVLGQQWKVTPPLVGLYRLRARVRFAAAQWSAENYAQLDVYKNGVLFETLDHFVIQADLANKSINLSGECEFVQTVITDYYQVYITTDDANGLKTMVGGHCFCERVGA